MRLSHDALEQLHVMLGHTHHPRRGEQLRVVLKLHAQRVVHLHRRDAQIVPRDSALDVHHAQFDPREIRRKHTGRSVLHCEEELKDGRAAEVTLRLQLFDQLLKRKILVRVSVERRLPHAPQVVYESHFRIDFTAQHQQVDEESDEGLNFLSTAICDRRPDHKIILAGVAVKQRLKTRHQRHEQRGSLLSTQSFDPAGQLWAKVKLVRCALISLDRRTWSVGGQVENKGSAIELLFPIGQKRFSDLGG